MALNVWLLFKLFDLFNIIQNQGNIWLQETLFLTEIQYRCETSQCL